MFGWEFFSRSGSAAFEGLRILVPQLEAESLEAAVTVRENLRSLTLSAYTEKIDRAYFQNRH